MYSTLQVGLCFFIFPYTVKPVYILYKGHSTQGNLKMWSL